MRYLRLLLWLIVVAAAIPHESSNVAYGQGADKVPVTEAAQYYNNWFRGERGCATAKLPELDSDWTVSPTELGVNIYLGKPASWKAQVMMIAWPEQRAGDERAEGMALCTKLMDTYTGSFTKANPYMKPLKPASEIFAQGGKALYQTFKGAADGKASMTATFRVIADGRNALLMRMWSLSDETWKVNPKVVDPLFDSVRVGSSVPKLPARDPGTAIEGVYSGPSTYSGYNNSIDMPWLIFDKRGYVLNLDPTSCTHINLEAYYQYRPNLVGRYTVKGGTLEIDWPLGEREDKRTFEATEGGYSIDGKKYRRMDNGWLDGKRLNGQWSHSEFSSTTYGSVTSSYSSSSYYSFFDNGKFKRSSTGNSNYMDTYNAGTGAYSNSDPGFTSWAGAHSSEFGVYRIEGDVIVLNYADGTTTRMTAYVNQKDDLDLIYFWGTGYLKSKSGPGDMPPDMPSASTQPKPPAPFVPEIYRDGFLRARGGASILRLPKLDAEQYTARCDCSPDITMLTVFKGKDIDKTNAITLIYALPADAFREDTRDDKTLAREVSKKMADNFLKDRAYLKPDGDGREATSAGMAVYSAAYLGSTDSGAKQAMSVITVVDDKCVVLFLTLAAASEYGAFTKAVLTPTLNTVRVGGKIPKFDDQKPGVALSGVYCTEPDAGGNVSWYVFDPRGYVSNRVPTCECDLDLTALAFFDPNGIGRYEVKDGEIETAFAPPNAGGKWKFKQDGGKLTIGDRVYQRVDGSQRPRTGLKGKFEGKGAGAIYFTADGRFSTASAEGANAAKNAEFTRADCVETVSAPAKAASSGCYRIEGDRLLLWFEDGRKLCRPLFAAPGKELRLFIGGALFVAG